MNLTYDFQKHRMHPEWTHASVTTVATNALAGRRIVLCWLPTEIVIWKLYLQHHIHFSRWVEVVGKFDKIVVLDSGNNWGGTFLIV